MRESKVVHVVEIRIGTFHTWAQGPSVVLQVIVSHSAQASKAIILGSAPGISQEVLDVVDSNVRFYNYKMSTQELFVLRNINQFNVI